jgi:HTH-type transcriptional regulator/antitoxin HigA
VLILYIDLKGLKLKFKIMTLKPIKNDEEYETMLAWVDTQFDLAVPFDSPEGEQVQIALLLVKAYEDVHYPIPTPDPIEAVKLKMQEKGIKNKDLAVWIGSKSYVSALLSRKKPLTLRIAQLFHQKLGIPSDILLGQ